MGPAALPPSVPSAGANEGVLMRVHALGVSPLVALMAGHRRRADATPAHRADGLWSDDDAGIEDYGRMDKGAAASAVTAFLEPDDGN